MPKDGNGLKAAVRFTPRFSLPFVPSRSKSAVLVGAPQAVQAPKPDSAPKGQPAAATWAPIFLGGYVDMELQLFNAGQLWRSGTDAWTLAT